jgi:site-specific DNA-methyltransferase (adenine-specific)
MTVELYCGNNLDILPTLEAGSVPLVITDPPYGIGYHSNYYKGKNPHAPVARDWNFQIGAFLQECARVLKDGGALYLFCRWDVAPLWIPHIAGSGLKVKTSIAWVKDNWSAGDLKGCFGNQYEQMLFIVKGRHLLRGKRWSNVWEFPRVPPTQMLMPTQKPVELLERAILSSSDEGDLVVDPFCGSSSTAVAALRAGRDALMIDIDSRMIAISQKRLGLPVTAEQPRIESPTPRFEMPDPAEWGIHPEELQAIWAMMQGNAEVAQPEIVQAAMPI